MILIEDTRNQINKHKNIHKYCKENDIEIIRNKLIVGDYMLPNVSNISIDTKFGLQEIMKNITEKRLNDKFYRETHKKERNKKQLQRKESDPVYKLFN